MFARIEAPGILALSLAAVLAGMPVFLRAARRWGLLDRPNERSSHAGLVPRGGGVVLLLAAAGSLALLAPWAGAGAGTAAVLGGAAAMSLAGLVDDRVRLSIGPRLAAQVVTALLVVWAAGGLERLPLPEPLDLPLAPPVGAALAVVWLVAAVNFYNFLDGIDGLAGLQGAITGLGIALAAWDGMASAAGAALAGGCLGFLVFNRPPARVFLGDAGSALLGFAFAALPLLAPAPTRSRAVLFVALSLWLFLADATWTLGRRLLLRRPVLRAHREHVYQRLVETGLGHGTVTLAVGLGSALLTALALAAWRGDSARLSWVAVAAAMALFALELLALRRRRGGGERRPSPALGGQAARLG